MNAELLSSVLLAHRTRLVSSGAVDPIVDGLTGSYSLSTALLLAADNLDRPGWQPIETAPKRDAPQILTFRRAAHDGPPLFGRSSWFQTSWWSAPYGKWVGWPFDTQPTHWMPLPKAPA